MSSKACSGGFRSRFQPGGASAGSSKETSWLRVLLTERLTEYGSVTRLVTTPRAAGA